jgi:hypothetical protein
LLTNWLTDWLTDFVSFHNCPISFRFINKATVSHARTARHLKQDTLTSILVLTYPWSPISPEEGFVWPANVIDCHIVTYILLQLLPSPTGLSTPCPSPNSPKEGLVWPANVIDCHSDTILLQLLHVDCHSVTVRGLTRECLTLLMPLFFFSVKRLLCYIILVLGMSLGELPNLFVLDFLCQTSISCILSLLWKKRL